jgi:hypothetical protein
MLALRGQNDIAARQAKPQKSDPMAALRRRAAVDPRLAAQQPSSSRSDHNFRKPYTFLTCFT